jgi:Zn-dependent peptidase ImmA (M78 family)
MSRADAEAAAREFRHRLGIGSGEPIDVLKAAQDAGALVVLRAIQDGPQGMIGLRGADAWIFVNVASATPPLHGRLRFTIAHELGHWDLGHGGKVDQRIDLRASTGEEADANAFAAELLVPGIEVVRMLGSRGHRPDLEALIEIAARFGVSAQVALFRLDRAGLITPSVKRRLNSDIDRGAHLRGAHRQLQLEFADQLTLRFRDISDHAATLVPRELMRRVEDLWEHGVLDNAEAAAHAHMSEAAFLRRMRQRGVQPATPVDGEDWW